MDALQRENKIFVDFLIFECITGTLTDNINCVALGPIRPGLTLEVLLKYLGVLFRS